MKKYLYLALIILTGIMSAQVRFNAPASFKTLAYVPNKWDVNNDFGITWANTFAVRLQLSAGKFMAFSGGTVRHWNTGRYDFTSRSFAGANLHAGLALLSEVKEFSFGRCMIGAFARRVMHFANDLPPGEENRAIYDIVRQYKADNPGRRMLYYNQHGAALIVLSERYKAELFIHSPLEIPVVNVVPHLAKGETPVSIMFILFEYKAVYGVTALASWEVHAQGASYKKAVVIRDGTGGIVFRKTFHRSRAGTFSAGTGWRQEMDMTGFKRSAGYHVEMRVDR